MQRAATVTLGCIWLGFAAFIALLIAVGFLSR